MPLRVEQGTPPALAKSVPVTEAEASEIRRLYVELQVSDAALGLAFRRTLARAQHANQAERGFLGALKALRERHEVPESAGYAVTEGRFDLEEKPDARKTAKSDAGPEAKGT